MDHIDFFNTMKPGFFDREGIRSIPKEEIYEEQIMDLHAFSADAVYIACPGNITFGTYSGDIGALREVVRTVEESWPGCYNPGDEVYCAFDGDRVVSFCLIEDFGNYKELRVGGPGCVGTIPEYRRQGIGLKMVQNVTAILKDRGYDIGYIHYTGIGHWYAKLGYNTIIRWNSEGVIE